MDNPARRSLRLRREMLSELAPDRMRHVVAARQSTHPTTPVDICLIYYSLGFTCVSCFGLCLTLPFCSAPDPQARS